MSAGVSQRERTTGHVHAAFLFGVNIPGGVWFRREQVESQLQRLAPALTVIDRVGDVDNLLVRSEESPEVLQRWLQEVLNVHGVVVIPLATLRKMLEVARGELQRLGLPAQRPFRATVDGLDWELGLVLASETLPERLAGDAGLFAPEPHARALRVLERRALLVQKRQAHDSGTRIMWGSAVIDPWRAHLERAGVSVACLTSRSLTRITDVVNVGETAEGATPRVAGAGPVYVAGPLFSDAERALNARVAEALDRAGYRVYLPQRDAPPATGSGYAARVFRANTEALARAGVVVAVCEGIQVDDGTAWEIGHAAARGIPVYGYRTDTRRAGGEERVNVMIEQSLAGLAASIDDLLALLARTPARPG